MCIERVSTILFFPSFPFTCKITPILNVLAAPHLTVYILHHQSKEQLGQLSNYLLDQQMQPFPHAHTIWALSSTLYTYNQKTSKRQLWTLNLVLLNPCLFSHQTSCELSATCDLFLASLLALRFKAQWGRHNGLPS